MAKSRKSSKPSPEFAGLAKQLGLGPEEAGKPRPRIKHPATPDVVTCDVASAACLTEELTAWLWQGRVPLKNVTLLCGPSEVGKSTIATILAAAVTTGAELPGGPAQEYPRSVLWYAAEEQPEADIKPRLRANGAVQGRVFFPELRADGSPRPRPQLPRDMDKVLDLARQLNAGLIIFDPITSYCEDGSNPDHGCVARPVLQCLRQIAVTANCCCLPIKHPKKYVPGGSPLDLISGSKEWTNVPRSVLLCSPHPDDEDLRCLAQMKGSKDVRHAPTIAYRINKVDGLPCLAWEDEVAFTAEQLLDVSGSAADRDVLADAKMLLTDRLADGEQKAKDLLRWAEESGITPYMLRKAKKALRISSHTVGPIEARCHVWRPPPGGFFKPGA